MTDEEIEVLEFVRHSKTPVYFEDIPFYLSDLRRLHKSGHIYANSDYGYDMGCEVDIYHLTEKGRATLEEHYLERRLKGLLS